MWACGTTWWLFEGNGPNDPMFLQIKQEVGSAYAKFLGAAGQHQGKRVAEGQSAFQPLSDLLLGWTSIGSHHYLVRQLNDHKGGIDLQLLRGGGLNSLTMVAGELLARGHARSGDACQIYGYYGSGVKIVKALNKSPPITPTRRKLITMHFWPRSRAARSKLRESILSRTPGNVYAQ